MRFARIGAVAALGLTTVTLTGCTPGILGVAGIERVGDRINLVVATCPDDSLGTLNLRDHSRSENSQYVSVAEWQMPSPDEGLAFVQAGSVEDFTGLLGSASHSLNGSGGWPWPTVVGSPVFTADDVEALRDGEVFISYFASSNPIRLESRDGLHDIVRMWCNENPD